MFSLERRWSFIQASLRLIQLAIKQLFLISLEYSSLSTLPLKSAFECFCHSCAVVTVINYQKCGPGVRAPQWPGCGPHSGRVRAPHSHSSLNHRSCTTDGDTHQPRCCLCELVTWRAMMTMSRIVPKITPAIDTPSDALPKLCASLVRPLPE